MNTRAAMTQTKKQWIRGALLAAALAACQSGAPTGEPKDDPEGTQDIVEALAALPEAEVLEYSADGIPQYVVGHLGEIDASQPEGLIADDRSLRASLPPVLKVFRLENKDLELRRINTDEMGARHYRYDQVFNGLPVIGGDLIVHVDIKGAIFGVNGTARGDIAPSLGAIAITEGAANLSIENDSRWAAVTGRTVRPLRTVYIQTAEGTLHKAYEHMVEGKRGQDPIQDKVYVDVDNGAVVAVHPQIHHARNRATYNLNGGTGLPGSLARSEGQGPVSDIDVNAAHDGAGHTYDLYAAMWNRDSIDNAGMQMKSSVHYSTNYCNAFWNNVQMVYGDGNASQNCLPLARSIDVAAHEMTHGVTSRESNLTYSGESGGLNESLSDVWGGGVEAWVDAGKTNPVTFSLANDVFLIGDTVLPPFLRSMCDPAADGVSRDEWSSSLGSIDVHYSSGPNNLVFCLLSKGGKHPRGKTTNNVPAIGMEKALRLMYKANVDLLTSSSKYSNMRTAMEQAATQLFPNEPAVKDAVGCAYAAIKVGTAPASCGGSPPPPPPPPCSLSNGVPVTGLSGATGEMRYCSINVPAGQTSLTINIAGGTGDADLYVRFGSQPTTTTYQCRPYLNGNNETCTFTPPSAGTYHIGLHAYTAYSGVTLTGTYSTTGGGDPYLTNGVPVTGLSGASASLKYYRINVPSGKNLQLRISGGTGDADMYTRFGARPTTSTYSCRPYLNGNNETCNHTTTSTTAGDWYVMLRGYTSYSGVTLIGSY